VQKRKKRRRNPPSGGEKKKRKSLRDGDLARKKTVSGRRGGNVEGLVTHQKGKGETETPTNKKRRGTVSTLNEGVAKLFKNGVRGERKEGTPSPQKGKNMGSARSQGGQE